MKVAGGKWGEGSSFFCHPNFFGVRKISGGGVENISDARGGEVKKGLVTQIQMYQ